MAGASTPILRPTQISGLVTIYKQEGVQPSVTFEFKTLEKAQNAYERLCADKEFMKYVKVNVPSKQNSFEIVGVHMICVRTDYLIKRAEASMGDAYSVSTSIPEKQLSSRSIEAVKLEDLFRLLKTTSLQYLNSSLSQNSFPRRKL